MKRIIAILFLFLNLNSFADGCSGDATFIASYDSLNCCWSFVNTTTNDCMEWNCTWDFGDGSPPVTTAQGVGTACHPYISSGTYTVTLIFDSSPCHGGSGGICFGTQEVTIPQLPGSSTVSNYNGYNISCEGANNGWIQLDYPVEYTYEWQTTPIQHGSSISNLTAGTYTCIVGYNGCLSEITVTLTEPLLQVANGLVAEFNVAPNTNMHHLYKQLDNPIFFIDKSVDEFTIITKWFWEFEDGFTSNEQDTRHSFADTGDFNVTLAIENLYGCVDTITKRVIIKEFLLYIPNSFTPNGDEINDFFLPKGMGVQEYKLDIFDRWGERIFTSNHLSGNEEYCPHNQQDIVGWNGTRYSSKKTAPLGVYIYVINLEDVFGKPRQYIGQITLIR